MIPRAAARLIFGSLMRCVMGCIILAGFGGWARDAAAQFIVQSMSGTLTDGQTDTYGYFGPRGGNIGGLPFGVTYTYALDKSVLIISITVNSQTFIIKDYTAEYNFIDSSQGVPGLVELTSYDMENRSFYLYYDTAGTPTLKNPSVPEINGGMVATLTRQNFNDFEIVAGQVTAQSCGLCVGLFFRKIGGEFVNVESQKHNVVIGQKIELIGEPFESTVTPWQIVRSDGRPIGVVGGYTALPCIQSSCAPGRILPVTSDTSGTTFYWYRDGDYQVSYNNMMTEFYVNRPGKLNISIIQPQGLVQILSAENEPGIDLKLYPKLPYLSCGYADTDMGGIPCLTFRASSVSNPPNFPNGIFEWVQIISHLTSYTYNFSNGSKIVCTESFGLDTAYPYGFPYVVDVQAEDSPAVILNPANPRLKQAIAITENFKARMYLMWNPGLTGSTFVPVSDVDWEWNATAQKQGDNSWETPTGKKAVVFTPVEGVEYPEWNKTSEKACP